MSHHARAAVLGIALAFVAGCGDDPLPGSPRPANVPTPNTPLNALRTLEWGWNHLDVAAIGSVLADDFVFAFAAADSAGQAYRTQPWTRADELTAIQHLFVGGTTEPPAVRVELEFDANPLTTPDPRPGRDTRVRRAIRTGVHLRVHTSSSSYEVQGHAQFYFTRGDSAAIPPELVAAGVRPDSTRWWIDRCEDATGPAGSKRQHPDAARQLTWGRLKVLYL